MSMATIISTTTDMDIGQAGQFVDLDVSAFTVASVMLIKPYNTTVGTGVFTLKRSLDGVNFLGLETAVTISSGDFTDNAAMSDVFDVVGFNILRVEVTTASASSFQVEPRVWADA